MATNAFALIALVEIVTARRKKIKPMWLSLIHSTTVL